MHRQYMSCPQSRPKDRLWAISVASASTVSRHGQRTVGTTLNSEVVGVNSTALLVAGDTVASVEVEAGGWGR
jgi:hypothetical protein